MPDTTVQPLGRHTTKNKRTKTTCRTIAIETVNNLAFQCIQLVSDRVVKFGRHKLMHHALEIFVHHQTVQYLLSIISVHTHTNSSTNWYIRNFHQLIRLNYAEHLECHINLGANWPLPQNSCCYHKLFFNCFTPVYIDMTANTKHSSTSNLLSESYQKLFPNPQSQNRVSFLWLQTSPASVLQ